MRYYTIYVDPLGLELTVLAESEREAYQLAWLKLTDAQRDATACLDMIDVED